MMSSSALVEQHSSLPPDPRRPSRPLSFIETVQLYLQFAAVHPDTSVVRSRQSVASPNVCVRAKRRRAPQALQRARSAALRQPAPSTFCLQQKCAALPQNGARERCTRERKDRI